MLVALMLAAVLAPAASAQDLGRPAGPVALTVGGSITISNRGPIDPFQDSLLAHLGTSFEVAAEFDRSMLRTLGMTEMTVRYPAWPSAFTFTGPLLADLLAATGAEGTTLRLHATDSYISEMPVADLERYPVMLALTQDGRMLGLGDRGPTWVIYPRDQFPELVAQENSFEVWSVVYIEVVP